MGWIIASAAFLVFLLVIPLSVDAVWDSGLRADMKWLCFRKTVYPMKKKESGKQGEPGAKAAEKGAGQLKKKKISAENLIDDVLDYIKKCGGGIRMLLRNLRISLLKISWTIAGSDAAECAVRYGRMNAYLHGALTTLCSFLRIKKTSIVLMPDYTAEDETFSARAVFSITPLVTIIGLVRAALGFLMKNTEDSNKMKQQRSWQNERKESGRADGRVNGKPQGAD